MKPYKSNQWIERADELIRHGRGQEVREILKKIQRRGVPKDQLLECATLARRVGMFSFGLNILFKNVYQEVGPRDDRFIAEYAANSSAAGNYVEATKLFENLPESVMSRYVIEYADSLFKQWKYSQACQILKEMAPVTYISYRDLVYGLNLSCALIEMNECGQALQILSSFEAICKKNDLDIILANSLELKGQIFFRQGELLKAESLFIKSEALLKKSGNISWLYSNKWRVIVGIALSSGTKKSIEKLAEVRKLAREYMHWETLRECDFYEAMYSENQKLFQKVYFGTPHEHYRRRALQLMQSKFLLNPEVTIGLSKSEKQYSIDLVLGDFSEGSPPLNLSMSKKRMLQVLTCDLYRPVSIYEIFHYVFQERYFNPFSSRDRTYKAVATMKKLLEQHPSGVSVTSKKGYGYRFRASSQVQLIYPKENNTDYNSFNYSALRTFGEKPFSRNEFCNVFQLSERSGNRRLKAMVEDGQLEKVGHGPSTRYRKII